MPAEVWFIRCEGGSIEPMQLPLGEGLAARLASGALVRVNEDGSHWTAEVAPLVETVAVKNAVRELAENAEVTTLPRPVDSARKPLWIAYAVSTGLITQGAAEDLTKDELISRFGG